LHANKGSLSGQSAGHRLKFEPLPGIFLFGLLVEFERGVIASLRVNWKKKIFLFMANPSELSVLNVRPSPIEKPSRREMVRRLLAGIGAGAAWPFLAASHPIHKLLSSDSRLEQADAQLADENWKPLFLNSYQNETLIVLSEAMVPGSKNALVNRFIDLLLSVGTPENQQKFVAALAAFDAESQRLGNPFRAASVAEQTAVLALASSSESSQESVRKLHEHFEDLKGWITGAYYSSEAGMEELGWTGDRFFEQFPGCQHPEGHS
jgi:Gluconate 2-dehydrogenase subunit 3